MNKIISDVNGREIELRDQDSVSNGAYCRGEVFCLNPRDGGYLGFDKATAIELRDFLTAAIESAREVEDQGADE